MKYSLLPLLLLLSISICFSWTSQTGNYFNNYSSSLVGSGVLYEKYLITGAGLATCNVLIYNNSLITANTESLRVYSSSGVPLWHYDSTSLLCPVVYNNKIITASRGGISVFSMNSIREQRISESETIYSLLVHDSKIYITTMNGIKAYSLTNGSLLWAVNIFGCTKTGAVFDNKLVYGCKNKIYLINPVDGSTIFASTLTQEVVTSPIIKDNNILLGLNKSLMLLDSSGAVLNTLYYVGLSKLYNSNIAAGSKICSCAMNGLYLSDYEEGLLYHDSYLPQYFNCSSIISFDFNNDGLFEYAFIQNNNLTILSSSGDVILTNPVYSPGYLSVGDVDSDSSAELVLFSLIGSIIVYDTSTPELSAQLLMTSEGFVANFTNNGLEDSINATYSLSTPYDTIKGVVDVPHKSSLTKLLSIQPTVEGEYRIVLNITDPSDIQVSNNVYGLEIGFVRFNSKNIFFFDRKYYDFTNKIVTQLQDKDIDNDGVSEILLDTGSGYKYYLNAGIKPVADLYLTVRALQDSYLDNETLSIRGRVYNNADYPNNAVVSFYVNDVLTDESSYSIDSFSNATFSFILTNLSQSETTIKIVADKNNLVYEFSDDNNTYEKTVSINPSKFHNYTVSFDNTNYSLHNQVIKVLVDNNGDFDEQLAVLFNSNYFGTFSAPSNADSYYDVVTNYSIGSYDFNLTVLGEYGTFNNIFSKNLSCVYDSDCGSGEYCSGVCVLENPITGFITLTQNIDVYSSFAVLLILLLLSSLGVYYLSNKFFYNQSIMWAVLNFIIFFAVSIFLGSDKMIPVIFEEIMIVFFLFIFIK